MKKATIIESLLFACAGAVGIAEGWRLSGAKSTDLYQMMGPGLYILALSITLLALGVCHLLANRSSAPEAVVFPVLAGERARMIGIVILLCVNVFLIQLFGYIFASIVFFLAAFRLLGIKSWRFNLMLSALLAAVFYVVFVHFCSVVFPEGILFR